MSATTTVRTTRHGVATLNYCNRQAKAHNSWEMPRVLALSACLGLTPAQAEKKMQEIWRKKGTQKKQQIEAYTIVQSFDPAQFSYKNAKDINKVNELGKKFASRAFAGRVFTVATQADGKKHVLHNHITICSQDPVTLKSLRGVRTSVKYTREINDAILRENDYTPIKSQNFVKADSISMRKMREKHPEKPLRVDVIRDRLDELMSRKDISTWDGLIKEAKEEKLDVRAKFTQKGTISRVSYRLLDDDKELKMTKGIRPKRLGEIYGKRNLQRFLQENAEYSRNQKRNNQEVRSTVQGISATFGEKLDRRAFNDTSVKHGQDRNKNSNKHQNSVEVSNSTGSPQRGFKGITVYYPRSTSTKFKKPRNTLKRPRNVYRHFSHQPEPNYASFNSTRRRLRHYTGELDELKWNFKRLDSTPDTAKLWRSLIFDDDLVTKLKNLFAEYADFQATSRVRQRADRSSRTYSRSPHNAPDNEIDF